MHYRLATERDDHVIAKHYLAVWESYGTPAEHLRPDAEAEILAFIANARQHLRFAAYLAQDGEAAFGSVACQIRVPPYPEVIAPDHRRVGYIWSVYVAPSHRQRGAARGLVEWAVQHLREEACTQIILHSSQAGMHLYESLGFERTNEMRLVLKS